MTEFFFFLKLYIYIYIYAIWRGKVYLVKINVRWVFFHYRSIYLSLSIYIYIYIVTFWLRCLIFLTTLDLSAFPFCSWVHLPAPCWPQSLDNFVFPLAWRSSNWSIPVWWIPLDDCTSLPVFYELCDVSEPVKLLFSVLHYHILHSTPLLSFLTLYMVVQWYSQYGSFHNPQCRNQCLLFLFKGNLLFACKNS